MTDRAAADREVAARIAALPPLREAIGRARLSARKSLGQHFLLDLNLTRRIARAAGPFGEGTVVEIGPGPGGLTRALLSEGAGKVVAVERDARALAALADLEAAAAGRLELVEGDALSLAPEALGPPPRRVVANLPYNIATRLVLDWLRAPGGFESIVVMVQKEVALRLCAAPGEADYGRLSVVARWLAEPELLFEVPAAAFTPPPRVVSALVRLDPRPEPLFPAPRAAMETVAAAAFGQRRKMLRASLRRFGGAPLLEAAGLDPRARPETLTVEEFCRLARLVAARGGISRPGAAA